MAISVRCFEKKYNRFQIYVFAFCVRDVGSTINIDMLSLLGTGRCCIIQALDWEKSHPKPIALWWRQTIHICLNNQYQCNVNIKIYCWHSLSSMLYPFCADYFSAVTFCPDNALANLAQLKVTAEESSLWQNPPEIRRWALLHYNQMITSHHLPTSILNKRELRHPEGDLIILSVWIHIYA